MVRRIAPVAGLALLITMITAATAFASITPKIGVYGTPPSEVCLDGTFVPLKCNGKIDVFKSANGKTRQATIRGLKTGCGAIYKYLNSGQVTIKRGKVRKTVHRRILIKGKTVQLKFTYTATWTSSKRAKVTLKVSAKGKTGCKSSAFKRKTAYVKWFSATENAG